MDLTRFLWRKLASAKIGRGGEVSVKCVSVYGLGGMSRFKFGDGVVGVKEAELALSLGLSSKERVSWLMCRRFNRDGPGSWIDKQEAEHKVRLDNGSHTKARLQKAGR